MNEINRAMISKNILLSGENPLNKTCINLAGLIRIDSDLKFIAEMVKRAMGEDNVFLDYPGIVIYYRKCFNSDARKACLNQENFLLNMSYEQKRVHNHLIFIGNKHVAHPELNEYDFPTLKLALDVDGIAISINPFLLISEPIGKNDLEIVLELIDLARKNLNGIVRKITNNIIDEYNNGKLILFE